MSRDFAALFETLTGNDPFRWQSRLYERFAAGDIPDACDIPTGLGKTAVMAIWLAALDARPGAEVRLPRRLVYVVDRRAVVDQATDEAQKLKKALGNGRGADSLVRALRKRLLLEDGQELAISTLRGQLADNRAWLEDISRPAIVVGTVDMIGSRLLFSGYNVSRGMRPVHAALLGNDALIVLDEAHIAPALEQAIRSIMRLRPTPRNGQLPELQLLTLSATQRANDDAAEPKSDTFELTDEDFADEPVAKRLGLRGATKRIFLKPLTAKDTLADSLAREAFSYDGEVATVLVYADLRREGAVKAADRLLKLLASDRESDVLLLTGAIRGHERDALTKKPGYRAFRGEKPADGRTRYLVCTSAGEVGADLDAEAAVTDLVPLERMVQRLGRVNRTGRPTTAPVTVIVDAAKLTIPEKVKDEAKAKAAQRLSVTEAALRTLIATENGDASPLPLRDVLIKHGTAVTPPPPIPAIEREHLEVWSLTGLRHHAGRPEVEPFIRGLRDDAPQTSLAWRPDVRLFATLSDTQVEAVLAIARLRPAEVLEATPIEVAEWLQARARELQKQKEATTSEDGSDDAIRKPPAAIALVFRSGRLTHRLPLLVDESAPMPAEASTDGRQLLNGRIEELSRALRDATVLVESSAGGLDIDDGALNANSSVAVSYVNENLLIARGSLSNDSEIVAHPLLEGGSTLPNGRRAWRREGWRPIHAVRLPALTPEEGDDETPGAMLEYWTRRWSPDGDTTLTRRECALDIHLAVASKELERSMSVLGLAQREPELAALMATAMSLHDIGKRRPGMQRALGGNMDEPLAKSAHDRPLGLGGYRHEFGSLRDVLDMTNEESPLAQFSEPLQELALHLITSHHGHARPEILALDENDIAGWHVEPDAIEAALRFIRMQREWGQWGLAWLEAVFRAADVKVSRDWDRGGSSSASPATDSST